jgi:hypothetical protein
MASRILENNSIGEAMTQQSTLYIEMELVTVQT